MTVLVVDIGNTRIKWARLRGAHLGGCRAAAHSRWRPADYARRLFAPVRGLERVVVASVAGRRVDAALLAAARRSGVACRFVRVERRAGDVTVGYAEPWRLGVDRFAAMIGAHELFRGIPVCVVGIGTALTIDLLTADGRHRGGLIVPAPALMVSALLTQTHGIRRRAQGGAVGARGPFGRSTRDAIRQGARYAGASLIDRAAAEAAGLLGRPPLIILTGGGAGDVRPLLKSRAAIVPHLVLRGLAVLARGPPSRRT